MQGTPNLVEESPSNIRMLSSERSLGSDQINPKNKSAALERQREESDGELVEEEVRPRAGRSRYVKIISGLLLLSFVVFIIIDSTTNGYVKDCIEFSFEWIEDHPIRGVMLFVVVYFFATVLFIPGSILTMSAGFVFASAFGLGGGIILVTLSTFIGASIGAIASFLLGRYLLRDFVQRLANTYTLFEALEVALQQNGLKIFLLLRLSPIIPFNATNYIGGVSAISFRDFVLALFGILPGTILYAFLGASAGSLADSSSGGGNNSAVLITVVVTGVIFGVSAIWLSARYARKELNCILRERQAVTVADAESWGGSGEETQNVYLAMAERDQH